MDGDRDGRGWAFRKRYRPDPVNGFTLMRQPYEATEDGFDGHVDVPTLWDRFTAQVVSIDATGIEVDLATRFGHLTELYPDRLRDRIDHLDAWIGPATGADAERDELLEAYEQLDAAGPQPVPARRRPHRGQRAPVGPVVRYDVGVTASRTVNPGQHVFPHL